MEKKPHLVSWAVVCSDKRRVGLGIRSPFFFLNLTLLGKWRWRFAFEGEVFWKQIIKRKYGKEEVGWYPYKVRDGYGVDVWKSIRKGWDFFFSRTSFEVGNGKWMKFWMDRWCGEEPLCNSFPFLYVLTLLKEAWAIDLWEDVGVEGY